MWYAVSWSFGGKKVEVKGIDQCFKTFFEAICYTAFFRLINEINLTILGHYWKVMVVHWQKSDIAMGT